MKKSERRTAMDAAAFESDTYIEETMKRFKLVDMRGS